MIDNFKDNGTWLFLYSPILLFGNFNCRFSSVEVKQVGESEVFVPFANAFDIC